LVIARWSHLRDCAVHVRERRAELMRNEGNEFGSHAVEFLQIGIRLGELFDLLGELAGLFGHLFPQAGVELPYLFIPVFALGDVAQDIPRFSSITRWRVAVN
jgi:hypothetical protein